MYDGEYYINIGSSDFLRIGLENPVFNFVVNCDKGNKFSEKRIFLKNKNGNCSRVYFHVFTEDIIYPVCTVVDVYKESLVRVIFYNGYAYITQIS